MTERKDVAIWDVVRVANVRKGLPLTSKNQDGLPFTDTPQKIRITSERVGCRSCGCPLDRGVEAIKVKMFTGYETRKEPRNYFYIHAQNCWANGFVQTMQLGGVPGTIRFYRNHRCYDGFYDINNVELIDPPKNIPFNELDPEYGVEPIGIAIKIIFLKPTEIRSSIDLLTEQTTARRRRAKERAAKKANEAMAKAKAAKKVSPNRPIMPG